MIPLLSKFVDLCLLRAQPQDLPASDTLLAVAFLANAAAGALIVASSGLGVTRGLLEGLADSVLMLGVLRAALQLTSMNNRFLQAGTALLATGALFSLAAVPLLLATATDVEASPRPTLPAVMLLGLILWNMVVVGNILRHTFNLRLLGSGVVAAIAYSVFSYLVMSWLFPVQ